MGVGLPDGSNGSPRFGWPSARGFTYASQVWSWVSPQVATSRTLRVSNVASRWARVTSASAQATRYRPGHYLTRHRDDPEGETRRLAYVLSLSADWHPDHGGLLMFFADDGTPRDVWVPQAGTLSLFSVRHVHSVSVVAPFAPRPRLSVTGWFSA